MRDDNPFDRALEVRRDMPAKFRGAAVDVTETLDLAWLAAQSVFEDRATPQHAIAICELMLRERRPAARRKP
jgi:hypothetical protein